MTHFDSKRNALPDWHPLKAIAMVYPFKLPERDHLQDFYHEFMKYIPPEVKIVLLTPNKLAEREIDRTRIEYGLSNEIEIWVYPELFDIWIRDYAPLYISENDIHVLWKFQYRPSYVEKKYLNYIEADNRIGEELGERVFGGGINTAYYKWDLGNLTHNGGETAIISNRLIADNQEVNINHELKSVLHVLCGFDNIIFIPTEPGDATGHVDGMVRFIDEKLIVVGSYSSGSENHLFMNKLVEVLNEELGEEFTILRLRNGDPEDYENEGMASALGNHLNFLRIGNRLLLPYYCDEISKGPMEQFQDDLIRIGSNIEIIPVKADGLMELARAGGVLNCITWGIY